MMWEVIRSFCALEKDKWCHKIPFFMGTLEKKIWSREPELTKIDDNIICDAQNLHQELQGVSSSSPKESLALLNLLSSTALSL